MAIPVVEVVVVVAAGVVLHEARTKAASPIAARAAERMKGVPPSLGPANKQIAPVEESAIGRWDAASRVWRSMARAPEYAYIQADALFQDERLRQ
jgi:hypothetical protein